LEKALSLAPDALGVSMENDQDGAESKVEITTEDDVEDWEKDWEQKYGPGSVVGEGDQVENLRMREASTTTELLPIDPRLAALEADHLHPLSQRMKR
jgi:hypothetical protein